MLPFPVGSYLLKISNGKTRRICEIMINKTASLKNGQTHQLLPTNCLCLNTVLTSLLSLLLTLNNFTYCSGLSTADFEKLNAAWVRTTQCQVLKFFLQTFINLLKSILLSYVKIRYSYTEISCLQIAESLLHTKNTKTGPTCIIMARV